MFVMLSTFTLLAAIICKEIQDSARENQKIATVSALLLRQATQFQEKAVTVRLDIHAAGLRQASIVA